MCSLSKRHIDNVILEVSATPYQWARYPAGLQIWNNSTRNRAASRPYPDPFMGGVFGLQKRPIAKK